MAEEQTEVSPVEKEATALGWVPKEQFKGDEAKWVDAETFVERGRVVLPILRKQNQELHGTIRSLDAQNKLLNERLKATDAAIEALQEARDEDVKTQVEAAKKELRASIKAARAEGDVDAELDAQDAMRRLDKADREAREDEEAGKRKKKDDVPANQGPPQHPDFVRWQQEPENSWFGKDRIKTAAVVAAAEELRANASPLIGRAFIEKAVELAEERMPENRRPAHSRVEESRGSGGQGTGGSGKSYADLPAEAKQTCDRMAKNLVGPNRKHKDVASWRASYADQFFKS